MRVYSLRDAMLDSPRFSGIFPVREIVVDSAHYGETERENYNPLVRAVYSALDSVFYNVSDNVYGKTRP